MVSVPNSITDTQFINQFSCPVSVPRSFYIKKKGKREIPPPTKLYVHAVFILQGSEVSRFSVKDISFALQANIIVTLANLNCFWIYYISHSRWNGEPAWFLWRSDLGGSGLRLTHCTECHRDVTITFKLWRNVRKLKSTVSRDFRPCNFDHHSGIFADGDIFLIIVGSAL